MEILEAYGEISESLKSRIMSEQDGNVLKKLVRFAVQATTISEFESLINQ